MSRSSHANSRVLRDVLSLRHEANSGRAHDDDDWPQWPARAPKYRTQLSRAPLAETLEALLTVSTVVQFLFQSGRQFRSKYQQLAVFLESRILCNCRLRGSVELGLVDRESILRRAAERRQDDHLCRAGGQVLQASPM